MKIIEHRITKISARLNLMSFLVFGLLATNILLGVLVFYTVMHKQIEITPFIGQQSYIKSDKTFDARYLEMMSENFIYTRLNITPETVWQNYQKLLSFVDSKSYADFSKKLKSDAKTIVDKKIASHIEITGIKLDCENLTSEIDGVLRRFVGNLELPIANVHYQIKYQYKLGRLSIIKFNQLKED